MAFTLHLLDGAETGGIERLTSASAGVAASTAVRAGTNGAYCYAGNDYENIKYDLFEFQGSRQGTGHVFSYWLKGAYGTQFLQTIRNDADTALIARLNTVIGKNIAVYQSNGTLLGTTTGDPIDDTGATWHCIKFYFEAATSGAYELFIDGTSVLSGTGNFASNGTDVGITTIYFNNDPANGYLDDIYYGSGATSSADGPNNLEIFATIGDGSATTGGDTLDAGSWVNVQEIPSSDTNIASYNVPTLTERIAPDTIAVQTNLTGSVTDIDDDPDSPDANWLDATGKSTLRVTFPSPSTNLTSLVNQEFRVLMRKSATGPTSATERAAPDTIAAQTNLTGSVTDIDDDPDSPDANWLTASGSSTLRTTFPTPTGNPRTGSGLQEFRVLLRKNATGPSGAGTEDVIPNAVSNITNLDGGVTDIDDDPDSPDTNWMDAPGNNNSTSVQVDFPTPTNSPSQSSGDTHVFKVFVSKTNHSTDPTCDVTIYDGATSVGSVTGTTVSTVGGNGTSTGQLITVNVAGNVLTPNDTSGAGINVVVSGTVGGGAPGNRASVNVGAVRWENAYSATETQPGYEVKLYENGSEVSAAGSATGTLTDAGGNTVVSFTWDATNLGTADGSLVECYVNQTSGADRYIEVGAVEWNVDYSTAEETPGYEIKLYENGSEVVTAGSATGTLTDAGGDTVVSFTWNAGDLSLGSGANVECYVNQTDASPTRYIDIGAVEWNAVVEAPAESGWIEADSGTKAGPSGVTGLNEIVGLTTFIRTKYDTGSAVQLTHSLYRGNDTDGVTVLSLGDATAAWSNFFDITESATIVPLTTEHTRVGFGHPSGTDVDIDCAEVIGMVAHESVASYTLEAAAGSYTLTGSPAAFSRDYVLAADAGAYTYTGVAVGAYRTLSVDAGSYSITGGDADFLRGYTLGAEAGSFTLTGVDIDFQRDLVAQVDAGAYTYTGSDVNLARAYTLGTHEESVETVRFNTVDSFKSWSNTANAVDGSTATYAFSTTDAPGGSAANIVLSEPDYTGLGYSNHLISKVRARLYSSVTGTGTPKLNYLFFNDTYVWTYASGDLTNSTPGWSSYIELPSIQNVWTQQEIFDQSQVRLYGYDDTGTFTEARSYRTEYEVTRVWDQYRIIGKPVAFKRSLILRADAGSYTLTGADAALTTANQFTLDAASGSYLLTGGDVAYLRGYVIPADAGSYAVTGSPVEFANGWVLGVEAGSYSITGADVQFLSGVALAAEAGAYSLTGSDVAFQRDLVMQADAGSYAYTGADAVLSYAFTGGLAADPGTYALTGADADFQRHLVLSAGPGSYAVSGSPAAFTVNYTINADSGSYTVTGGDAVLARGLNMSADAGSYSLTGADATLDLGFFLAADQGNYVLSGVDAEFTVAGSATRRIIVIG